MARVRQRIEEDSVIEAAIPGYAGCFPGHKSENIHGVSFKMSNCYRSGISKYQYI
jgi:hypothetical protein